MFCFDGPAGSFADDIIRTLEALGFDQTPTHFLASFILNIMVLITTMPRFSLKPIAINYILSLRNEITTLCAIYKVEDVEFQFDSPLDAPAELIDDFITLNISGAMLSKNPTYWKRSNRTLADTKLLLSFLALVRAIKNNYDPERMAEILTAYSAPTPAILPANHLRYPGVGPRTFNPYRGFAHPTPAPAPTTLSSATRTHTKSNMRFNPFAPRSRPVIVHQVRAQLDLNDEKSFSLISDAPLRMQRRRAFGFGRF